MKNSICLLLTVILVLSIFSAIPMLVYGEPDLDYDPSSITLTITAGTSGSFSLKIYDTLPREFTFTQKTPIGGVGPHPTIPDAWVSTDPYTFIKPAGYFEQWVTVTITVPSGATAGSYAAKLKYTPREGSGCDIFLTVVPPLPTTADVVFAQDGVGTDFVGTVLTVDGIGYARADLPKTFTWTIGTDHTFAYHSPLVVDGKRYVWTSTSGLSTLQSGTITVPSGGGTVTGYYKTQYYLTVVSPYGTPGGMGWYDECTNAYATLATGTVDIVPGWMRAVFTGWSGDASGTGLTSDPIHMDGPKTATANWKIQYYLSVVTDPSTLPPIPGADWYDECTWVKLTAPTYQPSEAGVDGVRYKFSYWDVDGTSQGIGVNPIDIHMDEPHTATAHYLTQYLVSFTQTGAAVAPTVTYTADTDPTENVPFNVWVLADSEISYTYQAIVAGAPGVQYVLAGVTPPSPETVNGPLTILGTYKTQYYLTVCTVPVGLEPAPTPQSGWYDECTYVTLTAPSTTHIGNIVYNFARWQINQELKHSLLNPIKIHMDSPKIACARYCELDDPIGDINLDGKVDARDIATIAKHYGAKLGERNYNVACDLNLDGRIALIDLAAAARNFSR